MELLTGTGLWSVAIFTVIFLILVDLMHRRQHWTSRYPPGPVPWPVLGNLLQVDLDNIPYSLYKSADGLEARGCDQWTKGDAGSAVDLWQGHC
uniref:Cytochrome P450, family 2, subfamily d, polypeptide 34 n=1 Tax=Mus musculus TaxID=10090 RepID=A0A2R8VHH8_MOUSE